MIITKYLIFQYVFLCFIGALNVSAKDLPDSFINTYHIAGEFKSETRLDTLYSEIEKIPFDSFSVINIEEVRNQLGSRLNMYNYQFNTGLFKNVEVFRSLRTIHKLSPRFKIKFTYVDELRFSDQNASKIEQVLNDYSRDYLVLKVWNRFRFLRLGNCIYIIGTESPENLLYDHIFSWLYDKKKLLKKTAK